MKRLRKLWRGRTMTFGVPLLVSTAGGWAPAPGRRRGLGTGRCGARPRPGGSLAESGLRGWPSRCCPRDAGLGPGGQGPGRLRTAGTARGAVCRCRGTAAGSPCWRERRGTGRVCPAGGAAVRPAESPARRGKERGAPGPALPAGPVVASGGWGGGLTAWS